MAALGFTAANNEFPDIQLNNPYTAYRYLEELDTKNKLGTFPDKEKFLKHIGSVNIENKTGATMLSHAITDKNINIVKWLCFHGADVRKRYKSISCSYFCYALMGEEREAIADTLLDYGADPDEEYEETTALHLAVTKGYYSIVKKILEKSKKHINTPNKTTHWTPLYTAVTGDKPIARDMVDLLITNGADMYNKAGDKKPFDAAVRYEKIDIVKYFIDHDYKVELFELNDIQKILDDAQKKELVREDLITIQQLCEAAFNKSGTGDKAVEPST